MKLHKNIKLLAWFNFFLDFRFYAPVAILYFSKVSGSYALGMSVFSVVMLAAAIFEVPTGVFSDMIGRKRTLVLGSLSTLVSVVFYALGGSYSNLIIGAILEGLARSFYSGNNDSLLHDSLAESGQEKEYAEFLGKTGWTNQAALAITAFLGAVIAYWSFSLVMWLSVLPALVGVFIVLRIREPRVHKDDDANVYAHLKKAVKYFKENWKLRMLSLSWAIGYAQGEAGYQFRSAFFETLWPIWAIGVARLFSNGAAALSFFYSGKAIRKFGAFKPVIFGKIYGLFTNVLGTIYPNFFSPIIMSSSSFTYGAANVAGNALRQNEYTKEQRATMSSLNSLLGSLLFAVVSLGLGFTADILTPAKGLLLLQVLSLLSLVIFF